MQCEVRVKWDVRLECEVRVKCDERLGLRRGARLG